MLRSMSELGSSEAARLPKIGEYEILQGLLGDLVLRPWFDWVILRSVAHGYFPLSRAWAAAQVAGNSYQRFLEALPGRNLPREPVLWAMRQVERRRRVYESASKRWETVFFGERDSRAETRVAAELARHTAAHDHMLSRYAFLPFVARLPAVRWEVAAPPQVEARHGERLAAVESAFPAPGAVEVEASRAVAGAYGPERWLRFGSPVLGDTAWARVSEPEGVADPPTVIFLHGVAMENDMWRGSADILTNGLVGPIRVIRPEGPWHGRRRPANWYGGEPVIGRGPIGLIELFQAWVSEIAVLVRWARQTSGGPVALGGVSLGALASQLAAVVGTHWPKSLVPDALFLVATSGAILDVAHEGSLTRAVKLQPQIEARGWTVAELDRWLPLLEPNGPPVMGPERVVMVIGQSDDLTHHAGGSALAEAWGLPEANLFTRPQGHFSVSLGLLRDRAPIARLAEILAASS